MESLDITQKWCSKDNLSSLYKWSCFSEFCIFYEFFTYFLKNSFKHLLLWNHFIESLDITQKWCSKDSLSSLYKLSRFSDFCIFYKFFTYFLKNGYKNFLLWNHCIESLDIIKKWCSKDSLSNLYKWSCFNNFCIFYNFFYLFSEK